MKTLTGFGVLISTALFAAQPAVTNTPADLMIQNFLKAEAARLDTQFLEGVTNPAQWEARGAHALRVPFSAPSRKTLGAPKAFQNMQRAMMMDARARPATPEGGCAPPKKTHGYACLNST